VCIETRPEEFNQRFSLPLNIGRLNYRISAYSGSRGGWADMAKHAFVKELSVRREVSIRSMDVEPLLAVPSTTAS